MITIYFDLLPKGWSLMGVIVSRYAPAGFSGEIPQSLLFFIVFNLLSTVINLPFSYYRTFVLEEKFGFNKQTPRLVGRDTSHDIGQSLLTSSRTVLHRHCQDAGSVCCLWWAHSCWVLEDCPNVWRQFFLLPVAIRTRRPGVYDYYIPYLDSTFLQQTDADGAGRA